MTRGPDKQFDIDVALSQAMEVFWARGYEAASLSELLSRMGIGKKSLYDTFGNKRSLFLKALEYYSRTVIQSIRDRLLASGSPLANLKRVLQEMQSIHSRPGSCGCMLGTNLADFDTTDEEIARVLRGYLQQMEDAFCTAITRSQQAGELSHAIKPRDLARMLLCTTQGMALVGRVLENEAFLHSTVQATITLFESA